MARSKECEYCGGEFEKPKKYSWKNWIKRRFCCHKCEGLAKRGRNHPNWKGGTTPERQKQVSLWLQKATEIRERDGHKCTQCGKSGYKSGRLVVHHIKPWSLYPDLRFVDTNLITLCQKCHTLAHKKKWPYRKRGQIGSIKI